MPVRSIFVIEGFPSSLLYVVQRVHDLVQELIAIAPRMVFIPDGGGNYPLHIAIHHQQSYQVSYQIYRAFPDMGKIRDVKTKLVPFMLAAIGNWQSEVDQITTTYQLLQEDPLLVLGV